MTTSIEHARRELAKWEARVTDDRAALTTAMRDLKWFIERLEESERTANRLRDHVQHWDLAHSMGVTPNSNLAS